MREAFMLNFHRLALDDCILPTQMSLAMKINLAQWKAEELERTVRDLGGLAAELDRKIKNEEARTSVVDPGHPAYSSFAASARERLARLRASIVRFEAELDVTRRDVEQTNATKNSRGAGKARTS